MSVRLPLVLILGACSNPLARKEAWTPKGPEEDSAATPYPGLTSGDTDADTGSDDTAPDPSEDTVLDTGTTDPPDHIFDCGRILVYSTEGVSTGEDYLDSFSALAGWLEPYGWEVTVRERAIDGDLTWDALEGVGQLWVFGTDRRFDTPLTDAEFAAAISFADGGGGLLVAADHSDANFSYNEDVNDLSGHFGLRFDGSYYESTDVMSLPLFAPAGPLVDGVTTLPGFASVANLQILDPAVTVAFELGGHEAVAWRDDTVRVVFDRSWIGYADWQIEKFDQLVFINNVANFLDPCGEMESTLKP